MHFTSLFLFWKDNFDQRTGSFSRQKSGHQWHAQRTENIRAALLSSTRFLAEHEKSFKLLAELCWFEIDSFKLSCCWFSRNNLAKVQIYFADLNYEAISELEAYTVSKKKYISSRSGAFHSSSVCHCLLSNWYRFRHWWLMSAECWDSTWDFPWWPFLNSLNSSST